MPIQTLNLTSPSGYLIQVCSVCGYKQKVNINRGAVCTKDGPFALNVGDTLEIAVDGGSPQTATFAAGSFVDFTSVDPMQFRDVLNSLVTGLMCRLDESPSCVAIESATLGPNSKVEILGGTAMAALGLELNDLACSRPVLGISVGSMKLHDSMLLRRCNGCTPGTMSHEVIKRTWDVSTETGTAFSDHRRAANALARYLKAQGMVHPDLAADYAAEAEDPPDYTPDADTNVIEVPAFAPVGS